MTDASEATPESYAFIHAVVEDGELTLQYRLNGNNQTGSLRHDEDVTGWSDREIRQLTAYLLGLGTAEQVDLVDVWR